nr:hypothetical protein Iba_chr05eCG0700 [Ipomoea batatas]
MGDAIQYMEEWHITFHFVQEKHAMAWPQSSGCRRP